MAITNRAQILKIYSSVPRQLRETFGPRNIFNKSEYDYVLMKDSTPVAFIEGKLIQSNNKLYYNIGVSNSKFCTLPIISSLFDNISSSNLIIQEFITTYGTDQQLQSILTQLGFKQIASRTIILSNHLINDASHIHFMRG